MLRGGITEQEHSGVIQNGRMQDAAAVREQRQEGWVPKVGSKVFVPRLGGDAKVCMVVG